jgi:hypothetical protein
MEVAGREPFWRGTIFSKADFENLSSNYDPFGDEK